MHLIKVLISLLTTMLLLVTLNATAEVQVGQCSVQTKQGWYTYVVCTTPPSATHKASWFVDTSSDQPLVDCADGAPDKGQNIDIKPPCYTKATCKQACQQGKIHTELDSKPTSIVWDDAKPTTQKSN